MPSQSYCSGKGSCTFHGTYTCNQQAVSRSYKGLLTAKIDQAEVFHTYMTMPVIYWFAILDSTDKALLHVSLICQYV